NRPRPVPGTVTEAPPLCHDLVVADEKPLLQATFWRAQKFKSLDIPEKGPGPGVGKLRSLSLARLAEPAGEHADDRVRRARIRLERAHQLIPRVLDAAHRPLGGHCRRARAAVEHGDL